MPVAAAAGPRCPGSVRGLKSRSLHSAGPNLGRIWHAGLQVPVCTQLNAWVCFQRPLLHAPSHQGPGSQQSCHCPALQAKSCTGQHSDTPGFGPATVPDMQLRDLACLEALHTDKDPGRAQGRQNGPCVCTCLSTISTAAGSVAAREQALLLAGCIDDEGTVHMWGANHFGQLGTGPAGDVDSPLKASCSPSRVLPSPTFWTSAKSGRCRAEWHAHGVL